MVCDIIIVSNKTFFKERYSSTNILYLDFLCNFFSRFFRGGSSENDNLEENDVFLRRYYVSEVTTC